MGASGPFIFPLWKPAQEKVREILQGLEADSYSCDAALVGATSKGAAALKPLTQKGFQVDHNRVCIGSGQAVFEQSRKAVRGWRHFQLGWAAVDPQTPVQRHERVAVVARSFGLVWTLNPLQIVYVEESAEKNRKALLTRAKRPLENGEMSEASRQSASKKQGSKVLPTPLEEDVESSSLSDQNQSKARFAYAHGTLRGHLLSGEERFLVEWKDDDTVWYDILTFSKPGHILSAVTYPAARFYQRQFAKQSMELMKAIAAEGPD